MAPLTGAERQTFLDFLTRFGLGCVQVARYGIGCRTATGDALRFVTAVIGRK